MTSNVSGLHHQHVSGCWKFKQMSSYNWEIGNKPNCWYFSKYYFQSNLPYNAPFFTTWFCTNWAVLYFPVYFLCRVAKTKCSNPSEIVAESLRGFRDKGFTGGRFLTRCSLFCGLWVVTNYTYIHSLRILLATDVMALFATNVCCVYLLSWVILHEQFVGVRVIGASQLNLEGAYRSISVEFQIVAVILCDTGIALFAYMDGISGSPTLGSVVLAVSAAAGSAVYKVSDRTAIYRLKTIRWCCYNCVYCIFVAAGLVQKSDRRDHVRSGVSVLFAGRTLQRRSTLANLSCLVLFRRRKHPMDSTSMAGSTFGQYSALGSVVSLTCIVRCNVFTMRLLSPSLIHVLPDSPLLYSCEHAGQL